MKKLIILIFALVSFIMRASAYDFLSGNLLYSINNTNTTEVILVGHVDGTAAQGELVIPQTVNHEGVDYTVTIIGKRAFFGCQSLTGSLVIPNSIVEIMPGAFYNCTGLTGDLIIPNSVTKMNIDLSPENTVPGAFENCTGFDGLLVLSNTLETIGDARGGGCFRGCINLKGELVFPNTLTYIGESAFEYCTGLTGTLVIPESVTEISHYAFAGCSGIEDVVFPSSPVKIGAFLFSNCTALTRIVIPEGWISTGEYTFTYCSNLNEVHLPESLTVIDGGAFSDCPKLERINFPHGVKEIFNYAFGNCVALESLDLPDNLDLISVSAFAGCTGLSGTVIIPAKELKRGAFRACTGISHLVLGESTNYVSELAFEDTDVESMTIKAVVPPELDSWGVWHFDRDLPVIVPCGTLAAFQNSEGWCEFTNMHEGITDLFSVVSSDENTGILSILKNASCEDKTILVEASPNEGFEFLYWKIDGEKVSIENPISFELKKDTELIAYFSGTNVNETEQKLSIYPNPVRDLLHLQLSIDVHPVQVELYDQQSHLVRIQKDCFEKIDMGLLSSGFYTMRIILTDGKVYVNRVVKE